MRVKIYQYVGGSEMTRGQYGVRISGGHTRTDSPDFIYVFDPDYGDLPFCSVDTAEQNGMVFVGETEVNEDPPKY